MGPTRLGIEHGESFRGWKTRRNCSRTVLIDQKKFYDYLGAIQIYLWPWEELRRRRRSRRGSRHGWWVVSRRALGSRERAEEWGRVIRREDSLEDPRRNPIP